MSCKTAEDTSVAGLSECQKRYVTAGISSKGAAEAELEVLLRFKENCLHTHIHITLHKFCLQSSVCTVRGRELSWECTGSIRPHLWYRRRRSSSHQSQLRRRFADQRNDERQEGSCQETVCRGPGMSRSGKIVARFQHICFCNSPDVQ